MLGQYNQIWLCEEEVLHGILSKGQRVDRGSFVIVGCITLFGALIRLYHLGFKPLWLDEAVLYWISNSGSAHNIITQNASGNRAPPLFAILLSLTQKIGDSEAILRLLPWLGGVAAIPAIYFLSRQFYQQTPAFFATLLVAIAPTQVLYSQQLREYSLTFLAAALMLALFYLQLRRPTWANWTLMTAVFVLGIFLQYGLALLIVALNLVFAIELSYARTDRKMLFLRWVASQAIVLCAVVAVYTLSLKKQMMVGFGSTSTVNYLAGAYWDGSLSSLPNFALLNTYHIFNFAFPGLPFLLIAGIGLVFVIRDRNSRTALETFAFPMILTFILATTRLYPYDGDRQDIFLTPMMYVLAGFGFSHVAQVIKRRWVVLLLALTFIPFGLKPTYVSLNYPGSENIRPIVQALEASFEEGDRIYVYYAAKPAFTYYYRDHIDSQIYGRYSRGKPAGYYREIDNLLLSSGRIWLVFSHCVAHECELIPKYVSEKRDIRMVASDSDAWLYLVP